MPFVTRLLLALVLLASGAWADSAVLGQGEGLPLAPETATSAEARPRFLTGFNQAWLGTAYGRQWRSGWDEAEAIRMLEATRDAGGHVLRMWLFEGLDMGGAPIWDGRPGKQAADIRTRPTGLDPTFLRNVERFLELAEARGVLVYLTLFDGNVYSWADGQHVRYRAEWWNLLNDRWSTGAGFREHVLGPILEAVGRHRSAVFGLDLINEGNALVKAYWFKDGWVGARRFVRTWRGFSRELVPDLPVTMSFGHHMAVSQMVAGRLSENEVDFYDFHSYRDSGLFRSPRSVERFAEEMDVPVYLGEFGQRSRAYDDELSTRVTRAFLENSRRLGLAGAFAWRLSDIRPGENPEARHSFEAFGRWRPSYAAFREWSRANASR